MRLFDILIQQGLEKKLIRQALLSGKVFLGGIPTLDGGREPGQFPVSYQPAAPRSVPGRDPVLLYQDPHIAVLYKPSGMLSVPASGRTEINLLQKAGKWLGKTLAVHRLDEETSGLLLVARTESIQEQLKDQFEAHTIERAYLALVRGQVSDQKKQQKNLLKTINS